MKLLLAFFVVVALLVVGWLVAKDGGEEAAPGPSSRTTEPKGNPIAVPAKLVSDTGAEAKADAVEPPPPAEEEPAEPAAAEPEPEEAPKKPADAKASLRLTKVSLDMDQASPLEMLVAVANEAGVPIVMAEDVRKELADKSASIKCDDVQADNALELILLMAADMKYGYELKDGKISIFRR